MQWLGTMQVSSFSPWWHPTLKSFLAIYGVEDRIEFIVGDYFKIIQTLRPDVVFLSPPWGGPEYLDQETFDLANMSGLDGIKIFNDAAKLTKNIAYFVPRNTDGAALAKLAGEGGRKSILMITLPLRPGSSDL